MHADRYSKATFSGTKFRLMQPLKTLDVKGRWAGKGVSLDSFAEG